PIQHNFSAMRLHTRQTHTGTVNPVLLHDRAVPGVFSVPALARGLVPNNLHAYGTVNGVLHL
ncbi:MAG: hypothetical protein EBW14_09900, partial [Oxalobacteraceae bacterium]|nr:hypothetical protein [Oxalobacteraceae bacterium]